MKYYISELLYDWIMVPNKLEYIVFFKVLTRILWNAVSPLSALCQLS